jgi:acyl-CoA reductase-like NAD-dependent aldehyde dehydrogenase
VAYHVDLVVDVEPLWMMIHLHSTISTRTPQHSKVSERAFSARSETRVMKPKAWKRTEHENLANIARKVSHLIEVREDELACDSVAAFNFLPLGNRSELRLALVASKCFAKEMRQLKQTSKK